MDSSQWGTYCKWDDNRPWHIAMPPTHPHYLKEERKNVNGRPEVLFEKLFAADHLPPSNVI